MKFALTLMLVLLLPAAAFPDWIVISLESAVKDSDLVVTGTLHDVSEETREGVDYGKGEITVDEVLWGRAEVGEKLTLVWQNASDIECPRVEHREHRNKRAIWLLTRRPGGEVAADNPGRFVPAEKRDRVLELLREREKF